MNTLNNYQISFIIDNRERHIIKEMETPLFIEGLVLVSGPAVGLPAGTPGLAKGHGT